VKLSSVSTGRAGFHFLEGGSEKRGIFFFGTKTTRYVIRRRRSSAYIAPGDSYEETRKSVPRKTS